MQPNKSEAVEVTPLREQIAVDAARIAAMSPETRAILEQELANILGNPGITFASQREPSEGELSSRLGADALADEGDALDKLDEDWSDCGNLGWCRQTGSCTRHNPEEYKAARKAALRPTDAPTRIKHYRASSVVVEDDAGEASERAMIVAYWRSYQRRSEYTPTEVADAIERGDHLPQPPAQETE